jgi:uncharacterized protein YjbJ (UPF0337 family)
MADKNIDEAKGRMKEAAGSLSGDNSLKREGKADRAAGSAKDKVDKAADKAKDVLGGRRDK